MKLNIVTPGTGFQWALSGMRAYVRQPLALSLLFLFLIVSMSMLNVVPRIGSVLTLALMPAVNLAMMIAAREASLGPTSPFNILRSTWLQTRQHLRPLLVLGAIYAGSYLLLLGITATVDNGILARISLFGGEVTEATVMRSDFQSAVLLMVALYTPLSMMFWHAPALVHWHQVSPVKSLFFSFVACGRNFLAFSVFVLSWIGIFFSVGIVAALLVEMFGNPELIASFLVPIGTLIVAMNFCSTYFTFQGCFAPSDVIDA